MWRGYASHLHTNTHPHTNTHTLHAHLDPGFHRFAKLLAESILDFHHVNLRKQSCESRLAVEVDALLFTHTLPITTLIHSLTHSLTHSHTRTLPHKSRTHSLTHSHKTNTKQTHTNLLLKLGDASVHILSGSHGSFLICERRRNCGRLNSVNTLLYVVCRSPSLTLENDNNSLSLFLCLSLSLSLFSSPTPPPPPHFLFVCNAKASPCGSGVVHGWHHAEDRQSGSYSICQASSC